MPPIDNRGMIHTHGDFFTRLLDLPMWLVGLIVVGGAALLGVVLVYGLDLFVKRHRGEEYNSVVSDGFTAVGTMYAIVVGLLVFGVYTTFEDAYHASADEASTLVLMYRNAQHFPQPHKDDAQRAVVGYINSVITDEWPALADGVASDKTNDAVNQLFDVYSPMIPDARWAEQYTASVGDLGDVVKLRNQRIDHAQAALPVVYWFLIFSGGFVTLLYLSLAYVEKKAMHALAVGLMAVMLGLVIFLLLEVNHPFRGSIAVSKDNFENALISISQVR